MLMVSSPRWRSAFNGADSDVRCTGLGVGSSSTTVAIRAMAIRAATPKNGPRQLMLPNVPPSSGPAAMPSPRAASYSTMAPANPPDAEATITAREVAMNSALPRPQPARKPTMPLIEPDIPAKAENTTMIARPVTRVRLAPRRLDTQFVPSIATAVTTR